MSQAMVLADRLEAQGHEISALLLAKNSRAVPTYFYNRFLNKIHEFDSPYFYYDTTQKGLNLSKTFIYNFFKVFTFIKSIHFIKSKIKYYKPQVVINFYEPLGGLAQLFKISNYTYYPVSHHFYLTHPDYKIKSNFKFAPLFLKLLNKVVALNASEIWALSFRPSITTYKNVLVKPPLIKKSILIAKPTAQNYILAYSVNKGYADEIKKWQENHSETVIHYFGDVSDEEDNVEIQKNLIFHKPNQELFEQYLIGCKGYISTAGFESICEALHLGKPTLLVPVVNHLEQLNNAIDAQNTGLCLQAQFFDVDKLIEFINSSHQLNNDKFKKWVRTEVL